ncbi:hypothetical protein [Opitutus sp. GAS368]|uniref:hypothetical protein n=1 Tax=Opitutus sp. GAS368 TaxID=1882749 RepID=UPI00087DB2C8|nr:hypothetical protein [Opitutus sp. GAS368]SDS51307.1 hypothetical protein SAMN05444173_3118 [Opitutus sp. GAS368]
MRFPFLGSGLCGPLAVVSLALSGLALSAPSASPETAGEVVKLPDVSVTDVRLPPPPESWQYVRLEDGTEVLSNAAEGASKRLLRDFQIFQQALEVVWPQPQRAGAPARTLILCGRRNKFSDFAAPADASADTGSTSLFLRNREQATIIVDLQASVITLNGQTDDAGNSTTNFEVDPYKQLYREYVRYLLSQGDVPPPAWVQEGMAQIVMAMEFTPKWIIFGRVDSSAYQPAQPAAIPDGAAPDDGSAAEDVPALTSVGDRPFNVALQRRALIPLDQFFAITADSNEARNPLGNNRWAKQAYAFVHLCLFGENGRFKEAYTNFTQRLAKEPVSEALFRECFKMSYKQMLNELRGYIDFTNHTSTTYTLKAGAPPLGGGPIVMREATDAEVGRIKGDAQRLAGRANDALATYTGSYARGAREPAFLAAYGVAASQAGENDRARAALEAAVKAGVRRPAAYVELARLRLAAAKARPAAAGGRLDAPQINSVLEALMPARRLGPPLPETYETAGETWLACVSLPPKDHLAVLMEGVKLFPRDAALYYALAEIYHRAGDSPTAAKVAQAGLALGTDAAGKARLEQLLASLPPAGAAK